MLSYSELIQWLNERLEIEGVVVSDIMGLPDPLRQTLQKMLHGRSMSLGQFAQDIQYTLPESEVLSDILVKKGYLVISGEEGEDKTTYRVRLAKIKGKPLNIDL